MPIERSIRILQKSIQLESAWLGRSVRIDLYFPGEAHLSRDPSARQLSLLLINDGQDMERLGLTALLEDLYNRDRITPLLCAGIHAGPDRKAEYGTAATPDYQGWGAQAGNYTRSIFEEVIPAIRQHGPVTDFKDKAFAGFSLGALNAMDIVWNHPEEFTVAGLFSGSFWWRTKDKSDPSYNDVTDRIVHRQVRDGGYYPWLRFFFECGTEDEQEDRNHNGVIDSIDDTQDLIKELSAKGYDPATAIRYLEIPGGHHDVDTWALAMPAFLEWGWGRNGATDDGSSLVDGSRSIADGDPSY